MPQIKITMHTNKIGSESSTIEDFDDEEWAELSDDEREDYVKQVFWENVLAKLGGWDWTEV